MGSNLINVFLDDTLTFSKRLAKKIGLNEAIFVQQLHYWLQRSNNEKDGHKWVYNSSKQWEKQLPFSARTIERIIKSLREKGIIIIGSYNKKTFDRTNWYRINYKVLNELLSEIVEDEGKRGIESDNLTECESDKMAESESDKMAESETDNLSPPIPENTTENNTENTTTTMAAELADVEPIMLSTGKEWRPTQKDYAELQRLFPDVDIKATFRSMRAYWYSHADRRRPEIEILGSVVTWIQKEQGAIEKEKRSYGKKEQRVQGNYELLRSMREECS